MNKPKIVYINFLLIILLFFHQCVPTSYNNDANCQYSTTAVEITGPFRGFVNCTAGITFTGNVNISLTTPINSALILGKTGGGNNATLYLESDLTLGTTASSSTTPVSIPGQQHAVIYGNNATIFLNNDLYLPASRAILLPTDTQLIIDGNGHALWFDSNFSFSILSGAQLTLKNIRLRNLSGENSFTCTGTLEFINTRVYLDNNWTLSGPKLILKDITQISGYNKIFSFASGQDLQIQKGGTLYLDTGTTFSWVTNRRYGLTLENTDATIYLNNSTLFIQPTGPETSGLRLTKGSLIFDNHVIINNETNSTQARSLELGDGASAANDLNIHVLSGARIEVYGYLWHNPAA